jgi:hypothetical protein
MCHVPFIIMKKGQLPYIPHLSHYIHQMSDVEFSQEYWYDFDFYWLDVCDAFFYLGASKGADAELERAKSRGMTIYYKLEDIPVYQKSK